MNGFAQFRDWRVMEGLEQFRYMRSDQIADMYFSNIKKKDQRIKKVSERMKKLHKRGLVKRFRFGCQPYVYTIDGTDYNRKTLHYLTVVDVLLQIQKLKPSYATLKWWTEKKFDDIICDLCLEYHNEFTHEHKFFFVEVELNSSGDVFEKISKYRRLFARRRRDIIKDDTLCIMFKEMPTRGDTERENEYQVKFMSLNNITAGWQW